MIERRLYKFGELTAYGVSKEYLRLWKRDDPNFPKPVRGTLYDSKAFEQYLDKLSGLTTNSSEPDYDSIFKEDLNGEHKGGLSHRPLS